MPADSADSSTSLTLLGRLRADDQDAWTRIVFLYGPLVRSWAARKGVTGDDADDVAQEVFRIVVARLAEFRRDQPGDSFRGWLFGVTRIVILAHYRRVGRQPQAGGGTEFGQQLNQIPDLEDESDAAADSPDDRSALYHRGLELVRAEFEAKTWTMFWQHAVDGLPAADVASRLAVSSAAVRQAKSRVLRRLREELGELLDTPPDK